MSTFENQQVMKVMGADFELSNALIGNVPRGTPPGRPSELLLDEFAGYPRNSSNGTAIEFGRRFVASSGGSWYIDSDHLEGNLPEHTCAFEHPQILLGAGIRQAQLAQSAAMQHLPPDVKLQVVANCSDGQTAWGSHFNVLVTRRCFDDMFFHKPHLGSFLATHLVTSVLYTGQGLVGPANGRAACGFQLSQRADWFAQLSGQQTMFDRPLLNLRDESHAASHLARAHIIFLDMVLSPVANILKAGTTQLVLAMIEAGWIDPTICLDDPVGSASAISRDLHLKTPYRTIVPRRSMTAIEIQTRLVEMAGEFVAAGLAENIVPDADKIVELWIDTLMLLRHRDVDQLARRCDNWLKYVLLERQRVRRGLSWNAAELKVLDSMFASLDTGASLFFQIAAGGGVERMPSEADILHSLNEPPTETRAYFRAHALRRFGHFVSAMNWDRIAFRVPAGQHWWSTATVPMPDPRRLNAEETDSILQQCESIEELVADINAMNNRPIRATTTTTDLVK